MIIKGIINYSHHLLEKSVEKGEVVIDATSGNGNDTLFLSNLVGEDGHVLSFDIQKQAIEATEQLLKNHNRNNVTLIHDNHSLISKYVEDDVTIGGAIFNLGYLPRGDKTIVTKGETTITAFNSILGYLKKGGIVVLVVYHGHDEGKEEKEAIVKHVIQLNQKKYNVLRYGFINQKNNPPFIIAIQKK